MVRVARPGGRVLIWDHNPRNPYWANLMARVPQDTGEERLIGADEVIEWPDARPARRILSDQQLGTGARLHAAARRCAPRRSPSGCSSARRISSGTAAHNVIVARKPRAERG